VTVLDRLPTWTTTGVGSLPFDDVDEAAAHSVAAYGLPFCPQLPRLEGDMIAEWLGADPARCGWSAERDRERPHAWEAWVRELEARPPPHWMAKLQVTGPVTLACALERVAGQRASRKEAIALARELAGWLAANASILVRRLRGIGLATILVVDEPGLAAFGTEGIERVWDPLRVPASVWGLHICCPVPWQTVERAEPDLLSFDLALDPVTDVAARALRRHAERGGWTAWGALRVASTERAGDARRRLEQALVKVDVDFERSLLTASCGSGRVSPSREREIAAELRLAAQGMPTAARATAPPAL